MPTRREVAVGLTNAVSGRANLPAHWANGERDDDEPHHKRHGRWQPVIATGDRAYSPLEALMQTAPHEDPEVSQVELLPLREVLADAIDLLPERERFVFDELVGQRRSIRELADMMSLGKSTVHDIKQRALQRLRAHLADHPLIEEYLNR